MKINVFFVIVTVSIWPATHSCCIQLTHFWLKMDFRLNNTLTSSMNIRDSGFSINGHLACITHMCRSHSLSRQFQVNSRHQGKGALQLDGTNVFVSLTLIVIDCHMQTFFSSDGQSWFDSLSIRLSLPLIAF